MKIGDRVRIEPTSWVHFVNVHGTLPGQKFNPGVQKIMEVHPKGDHYRLSFPSNYWWKQSDLILVDDPPRIELTAEQAESLTRAFCSLMEMWGRRYDYDADSLPDPEDGEPFPGPVVVDLGPLAVAQSEMIRVIRQVNPSLYNDLFLEGIPDAPLPPDPSSVQGETVVTNLEEVRIRMGQEFLDEQVAYVEAIWGKSTYAFNAAIRDLEAMRRGKDDGMLRRPETYHEGMLIVHHVRALANDLARNFGMDHLVREDDDLGNGGEG